MSSSSADGNGNGGARRGGDSEGPSLTRRRTNNEIWPGPFLEDLVLQVAIDASRSLGRLAAAAALANVFQVCLSSSSYSSFCFVHVTLHFDPSDVDLPDELTCSCLTLSDTHLVCGFDDGTIRLFELATRQHVNTFLPQHGDRFGRFLRVVSGIVISHPRIIFSTLDGNIHMAIIDGQPLSRRAHIGNVLDDGALVDFTGCGRSWVGLYAGVPGHAFHIWDGNTEELVYLNASLTDPEAVMGWHMLTEFTETIGRVRMTSQESAVACTDSSYMILDLINQRLRVTCFDTNNEAFITVDNRGRAIVRRAGTLEEVYRFHTRHSNAIGCVNLGYALMCSVGVVRT
ncbi:hypothetical protein ES332_D11G169800v1 [Gossypium tomentosum]|uniref:Uncharacterized protein n=1 Tax=Gossypium tomentosum TaxID=34277 RepID=A0A5D2IND0_GOSTO|nr:hypothetical protein ES332_D11G169800v1 [Gossypium tomentosum]